MRIRLFYRKEIKENRIEIHYHKIDHTLEQILKIAKSPLPIISVQKEGIRRQMDITDVCYIESVDKEVFIYSDSDIYSTLLTLQSISELYEIYGFVRVNKYTILNIYRIKDIKLEKQMKHMITLDSGEKMELSRSYRKYFFSYLDSIYEG